jgi:hypothetical protein
MEYSAVHGEQGGGAEHLHPARVEVSATKNIPAAVPTSKVLMHNSGEEQED